jgi:hypothetical protein
MMPVFSIEEWMAQEAATMRQMASEAWRPCEPFNGCMIAGNWERQSTNPRFQQVAVPAELQKHPCELNFGPGWLPGGFGPVTTWAVYRRYLDANGFIDLSQPEYAMIHPDTKRMWILYRYF